VETAESLPEVPDLALTEVAEESSASESATEEPESASAATDEPGTDDAEAAEPASEDQNSRSSTLSMPRSTS
jgi:hypothetical protein